jgi:hypothetical protein
MWEAEMNPHLEKDPDDPHGCNTCTVCNTCWNCLLMYLPTTINLASVAGVAYDIPPIEPEIG